MRLASHKLGKDIQKHGQTVKHKKSNKKIERLAQKAIKKMNTATVEMGVEGEAQENESVATTKTVEEKRADRKSRNVQKNMYKKQFLSFSGKNGPRAINRSSN
jgi:hypothetical protein